MAKGAKKKKANKGAAKESQASNTPEKDNQGNEEVERKDIKKSQSAPRKFIPRFEDPHKIRKLSTVQNLTEIQATFYCRECMIKFNNNVKPISMTCGHSICDMCIEDFMGKNYQCKKCDQTNEIAAGKFRINYLLINIMEEIMDDVYLRVKVNDTFNARGIKTLPPDAEVEEYVEPLTLIKIKAERKLEELEACKMVLNEETNTDKAQKKIVNTSEASLGILKENLQSVDMTSIIKAVSDLHYSIKPVDMKLSECRQSMGRLCSLDEARRKFLRKYQETGVEVQFNLKIVKELHDSGNKMVVTIPKKINSLWARLEWHEFGIHISCFNTSKPEDATFYFEYRDILSSECDGISHVWLDVAAPTPKGLKEKDPYNLCSFDLGSVRLTKDTILFEEEEVPDQLEAALPEAPADASSPDPKEVTDPTHLETKKKIVKKLLPSLRQRVYINLAETCYASHFAEFALGKDKVNYKDWNLKLEKPRGPFVVSLGNDGSPPSLCCRFTSLHPSHYLSREERGHVYASSPDMKSGAFKISLGNTSAESSLIGSVHSGIDFLDKIESYAIIKDCGVVLKFKKDSKNT